MFVGIFWDALAIFGAKYLWWTIGLAALVYFLRQEREKQKEMILFAMFALPAIYLAAGLAGAAYFNPRPFVAGNFTPLIPHDATNGFPSDHMLLSSALAALVFAFNKKMGMVLFAAAFLVGASRVYAGVHHWLDIFASFIIAASVAWVIKKYLFPWIWKREFIEKI